jgi:hypothetical protein
LTRLSASSAPSIFGITAFPYRGFCARTIDRDSFAGV